MAPVWHTGSTAANVWRCPRPKPRRNPGEARLATQKVLQRTFGAIEPTCPSRSSAASARRCRASVYKYVDPGWHRRGIGGIWDELGDAPVPVPGRPRPRAAALPARRRLRRRCAAAGASSSTSRPGHYYGIDRRFDLIEAGRDFDLRPRGLIAKQPVLRELHHFEFDTLHRKFDFALAQSVFTHLRSTRSCAAWSRWTGRSRRAASSSPPSTRTTRGPREIDDIEQKPGLADPS